MIVHVFFVLIAFTAVKGYTWVDEECLNYTVYPVQYELTIIPHIYAENRFYYDGEVTITVIANVPGVRVIELDAVDLEINSANIGVWYENRNIIDNRRAYEYDKKAGKLYLYLKEDLKLYRVEKSQYLIKISFRKKLEFKEDGIFVTQYNEDQINRYLISTRLSPDRARRMFPCFDNPQFEAVYRIRVYLPPKSQNPSGIIGPSCLTVSTDSRRHTTRDEYVIVEYLPSPQIAPHQVGFHLSHFINRGKIATPINDTIIVWAPVSQINYYVYILNLGSNLINVLYRYSVTKRPITNGPINLVPIPAYINSYEIDSWNLLTNGEHKLMYIEQYTSIEQKERMSFDLAQQLSRIWLGNPGEVARTRWREHWFKEGMATYLAYFLLSEVDSSFWSTRTYGLQTIHKAMALEWRRTTPALGSFNKSLGVLIAPQDKQLIETKTAALLWMVENWLGSEIFHKALQYYIEYRRGKFISLEDFAEYLQSETIHCEFFKGYTVSNVLSSWISQPGYPLVNVHVYNNNVVKLTQKHFTFNNNLRREYKYTIPISYMTQYTKECYNCDQPKFTIGGNEYTFKENLNNGWIILNRNASGYYRVNYDLNTWKHIIDTLKSPQRTKIDTYNRAQIVNDAFALYVAGEIDHELAFDILDYLDDEDSFVVWDSAFSGFELLKTEGATLVMSKQLYETWKKFMRDKVSTIYNRMANEFERDHQTRMFRSKVLNFACYIDHTLCHQLLKAEMNRIRLRETYDPDLRQICYYELQNYTYDWQMISKNQNRFEIEDSLAARNKFLREEQFRSKLPYSNEPPMALRHTTESTTIEVTPFVDIHTTAKPSSAVVFKLSVLMYILSAIFIIMR